MTTPGDIHSWLESNGFGELAPLFEENHITFAMLPTLTGDDIREMGITSLGQRKMLLAAIAAFNTPAMTEASSPPPPPGPTIHPIAPPVFEPLVQAAAPEPFETPSAPSRRKSKRKVFSATFLTASICLHLIVAVGAGYWVVQRVEAKRKLQFAAGAPTANPSKRAMEHKVSLRKKKNAGGSPAQARRIAVTGLAAKITLPEMPSVPTTSTQFVAGRMAGMGGAGFGSGMGFGNGSGMGVGGAGAGGLGLTMFGARGGSGLTGTFYDLKRDRKGNPNGVSQDRALYTKVLGDFTATWRMPSSVDCFKGKSKLVAKAFIFPAIPDSEAGKAFGEPDAGPGMWIAHYSGSVTVPVSGKCRFVGWGDNLLAVRLGSKTVLDASDVHYLGDPSISEKRGSVIFPNKEDGTPLFTGSWFTLTAGSTITIDVILGDEGGIYCAGLLLEKEGDKADTGKHGIPELPIFLAGPLGLPEKQLYDKYISSKALNGPVWRVQSGGGSSPLDSLKRP